MALSSSSLAGLPATASSHRPESKLPTATKGGGRGCKGGQGNRSRLKGREWQGRYRNCWKMQTSAICGSLVVVSDGGAGDDAKAHSCDSAPGGE